MAYLLHCRKRKTHTFRLLRLNHRLRRTTLKRHSTGFIIGIVVSIIVGFAVLVAVWVGLGSIQGLGFNPPTLKATITGPNSATLNVSTFPDSQVCHPDAPNPQIGWVTYCSKYYLGIACQTALSLLLSSNMTAQRVCTTISSIQCKALWEVSQCTIISP